jgi:hypothetical protein
MLRVANPYVKNGLIGLGALLVVATGLVLARNGFHQSNVFEKPAPKTDLARDPPDTRLATREELPPPTLKGAEKSEALVKRYPFDARVRYLRFLYYMNHNEFEKAEGEIDLALATEDILNKQIPRANLPHRFVYAIVLHGRGHIDEARAVAYPVCQDKDKKLQPLRDKLNAVKLCIGGISGE